MTFARASLGIVKLVAAATAREKARFSGPEDVIDVQFNPTSLKLQYSNHADAGGVTAKAQPRQNPAVQPSVLSFDLEYDTAEDPKTDVRDLTAAVRRFVQPPKAKPKSAPPLVQFRWGTFVFNGRVTQITEDIDYFSSEGRPLRAKLSLSITEQDPVLEGNVTGPGARTDAQATGPGGASPAGPPARPLDPSPGPGPGQRGTARPQQAVPALEGESLQGMTTRLGGTPANWRALATGIDDPLNLTAGQVVQVGAEIEMTASLGTSLGFAAGSTVGAQSGNDAAEVVGTASAALAGLLPAGIELTATGGVAAAAGRLANAAAQAGAGAARAAFSVPAAPPAPASEPVDPRLLSYGRALPLRSRPQVSTALNSQAGGPVSLTARARPREAPVTAQGGSPWERLTPGAPGRAEADAAQRTRDARPSTMRWRPGGECR
jgi:contractile injection system tube protein